MRNVKTNEIDLFHTIDESVKLIKKELEIPYLEALIHSAENLVDNGIVYNEEGLLTDSVVKDLESLYNEINLNKFDSETIRKAMQLALLSGMREDYVQPNYQMTPDSLGSLIAYLLEIIVEPEKKSDNELHLVDLSVGTGNLLLTVHHFLKQVSKLEISLSGVDNDDLMIALASTNSAIQRTPINLQYQDALTNLYLEPADIMVSDLPIGYYPVDEQVTNYQTHFSDKEKHSYSHYLLIEQAMNYLVDGGYGFFLLPSNLFNDDNISILTNYLNEVGYIQGVIQMPRTLFATEESQKSIFIIQKKGNNAKQMDEVLLSNAPDFKDFEAMKSFLGDIAQWKKENN